MTHQQAMRATSSPSVCTGEITLGRPFSSQVGTWTLGTCTDCETLIALLDGLPHPSNYVIATIEPGRHHWQGHEGMEINP